MANTPPFLSLNDRVDYLYGKHYFPNNSFSDLDKYRLEKMNFHYFVGYARNFRMLHDQKMINCSKGPSQVFEIIEMDTQISTLPYKGLRQAELLLRHYAVKHYCSKYSQPNRFLESSNFLNLGSAYSNGNFAVGLANDILRYGEKYVVDMIQDNCRNLQRQIPKNCDMISINTVQEILDGLPLWSVVDGFSLGHLTEFIIRCDNDPDPSTHIWRRVAEEIDFKADRFQRGLDSLRSLRNLVSHHARLWMRPTTYSMPNKGIFRKEIAHADPRSMIIAFYNLASFQGSSVRRDFANELKTILNQNPTYEYGISHLGSKR